MSLTLVPKTISGGCQKRLLKQAGLLIFSMLVMSIPAQCNNNGSSDRTSLLESLSIMEKLLQITTDSHNSLLSRLAALEKKVFGQPQQGALLTRVESLKTKLRTKAQIGEESQPKNWQDKLPLLNATSPNFVRIDPSEGTENNTNNYLADILKASNGKVLRFKTMPIPVYVSPFPNQEFVRAVIRGFEVWESRTNSLIRFIQVDSTKRARIIVAWNHLGIVPDASGCLLGAHTVTKYTHKGKGTITLVNVNGIPVPIYLPKLGPKYNVPPQIIEVNLDMLASKNPEIRPHLLQNIITHELGHALGIFGHSSVSSDMMGELTDEHSRLSQRDLNTIIKLYQLKIDVPL